MNRCRTMKAAIVSSASKAGAVIALLISEAHAQTATGSTPTVAATTTLSTAPVTSPVFGLMQGLVGLVIVVGLIYAVAWVLKKFGPRTRSSGAVQVIGGASVGPREKVVVVRFGHQTLLLGVAPGQVSLLHTADTVDPLEDSTNPTPTTSLSFVDRLRAARGGA
jgi:flagellar protein FliO/FliZ